MKIGLYFGSFNPIHIGHLIIAEFVHEHTDVRQVWFVVSPQNPFKHQSSLLNGYQRLHLVKIAIEENPLLLASDVEFKLPTPSFTSDTLVYLEEKYPEHQFVIVLGSDGFQNIKKWKNAEFLLKNYSFIIYKRPGFIIYDNSDANCILLDAPLLEISSTYIRKQIKEGKSVKYLLPDAVNQEINKSHYYK